MKMVPRVLSGIAVVATLLVLCVPQALAHWCSNIFVGPARLVIKPERSSVLVPSNGSAQLKVYFQNNFPYTLFDVAMRGKNPFFTISVTPLKQDVQPGQNVVFEMTITPTSGGGAVPVSDLSVQVKFRYPGADEGFRGDDDPLVNQSPSEQMLLENGLYETRPGYVNPGQQSPSLSMATLADRYPAAKLPAGTPFFGRTGLQQLIHWFGYRFCYTAEDGLWGCGDEDCPSPCAEGPRWTTHEEFSVHCMRAGVDLAIRKTRLGSELAPARAAAVNALSGGSEEYKCLAAVVGGMLWQGAADTSSFEAALDNASAACKAAGLRILGQGAAGSCTSGPYYEQAACAAAEGLKGNSDLVTSVLLPNAGDGLSSDKDPEGWQKSHFYAYMLYLVTGDHYSRCEQPPYYPSVQPISQDACLAPPTDGWVAPRDTGAPRPRDGGGEAPTGPGQEQPEGGGGGCEGCVIGAAAPASSATGAALVGLLLGGLLVGYRRRRRAGTGDARRSG